MNLIILAIFTAAVEAAQIKAGSDSTVEEVEPSTTTKNVVPLRHTARRRDDWKEFQGKSYKIFRDAKNFDDAEEICKREGGHLVSIHSEQENEFVYNLTTTHQDIKSYLHFVYIGLRKNTQTDKWYWTDGSSVNFTKWAMNQPDHPQVEDCGQMYQDPGPGLPFVEIRKWNDISCKASMKYFVCKK